MPETATKRAPALPEPPKPVEEMTVQEKAAYAEQLTAALDALRPAPDVTKLRPGSKIGEGLTSEYVPYDHKWFTDIEERKKEDPNYQLHEVIAPQTLPIIVAGVSFTVYAGIPCKLPTPHYLVYKNWLDSFRKNDELFAPPQNVSVQAGYISPVHRMPGVWSKAPITDDK